MKQIPNVALLLCVTCLLLTARLNAQPVPPVFPSPMPTHPRQPTRSPEIKPTPLPPTAPESILVPPPPIVPPYLPFPHLPTLALDEANNGIGIAQRLSRERNLQARILWVDGTANIDKVNSVEKINALVRQVKSAGFTTIVFDAKPIIGQTLYPSQYAPKLTEWVRPWKTQTLPLEFDPLQEMATQTKALGIELIVNLNAFSEGHREFPGQGPGDKNPEWQTILYVPSLKVRPEAEGSPTYPLHDQPNVRPTASDCLALFTEITRIKPPADALLAVLDAEGKVIALVTAPAVGTLIAKVPTGGAILLAQSIAAKQYLQTYALPGTRLVLENTPAFVPLGERPERQVPLMTNPHSPAVRERLLKMITEILTHYPVDGIAFDDRLRYASLNADFSPEARAQFEAYVGKSVRFPDDIFRYEVTFPTLEQRVIPGILYDAWLTFRALTLRNFVAEVMRTVRRLRADVAVGTYVGSWYPDYPDIGANWGANDLSAGFRFLNDSYRQTGWAGMVDFVITGCYYNYASLAEAAEAGVSIGLSVEAAGQFSNRAVNDQTVVYAGIQLDRFKGKPEMVKRVLQAAGATTQGIMVFDLSHDMEMFWSVFAEAFQKPTLPPHRSPGFLSELRALRAADKAVGKPEPPVILYRGASGTGF